MRVLLCSLLCAGFALASQAATVSLTSPPRVVGPGDLALHVFRVANPTDAPQEVRLSLELPQGWSALPISPTLSLEPGDAESLFVTVQVPLGAGAGDYTVRLAAKWNDAEASATAQVTVRQVAGLEVDVPQGRDALPGTVVSYEFVLINRGNTVDRYTVTAQSSQRHSVRVHPAQLPLAPLERGTVVVEVEIPPTAPAGRDRLLVEIQSTAGPAVRHEAVLFTTVLPPHPELIVGSTEAEVEAQLEGRLEFDLLGGYRYSPLSFAGRTYLLQGTLSFDVRTTGPWGNPPLRLDTASLSYSHPRFLLRAGEFTTALPPFTGLTVSGMGLDLFGDNASLSLLSGWRQGESRFAGAITLSGNRYELGTAYRETRSEQERLRSLAGWVSHTLGEHVEIEVTGSLSLGPNTLAGGLRTALRVEIDPLVLLNLAWHSVAENVPSPLADQHGMSVAGRISVSPLAFRFSSRWVWDGPQWGCPADAPFRAELTSSLDWAPEDWPVSFFAAFSGRRGWSEAGEELERIQNAQVGLRGGQAPLTFYIAGVLRKDEKFPNGNAVVRTDYEQRFTLTGDAGETTLSLQQRATFDMDGSALERNWQIGLSARLHNSPYAALLSWKHESPNVRFELGLNGRLTQGLEAGFTASADWNEQGRVASLKLGVSFEYSFLCLPPFLPARGWLEGTVLADQSGVEGAVLVAGGHKVATDAEGQFLFPPLEPGRYALSVERLPTGVRLVDPEPVEAVVELDRRTQVTIHCERLAEVRGAVFDDREKVGERRAGDPGVQGVVVALLKGEHRLEWDSTDSAGRFTFPQLSPGQYAISLDEASLPERYEPTTPSELTVEVGPGETKEVEFGVWQRPREVLVAPTPPLADFDWSPLVPKEGEIIAFDASLSVAGDGEIVAYQWDFTGDGQPDATGQKTSWTFSDSGVYWVTLVVQDELGQQDELALPIEVRPGD